MSKNNYLKIESGEDCFDYLNDLIIQFNNNKKLSIDELNYCGGRMGKKTYSIAHFCIKLIILAIKQKKRIAIYGFRQLAGKNIDNFAMEFQQALDNLGLNQSELKTAIINGDYIFKAKNSNPIWRFNGGSFISLQGTRKPNNNLIALKGLASCQGFDLSISIEEEANEFTWEEFNAIKFAIRGSKQHLDIRLSNPDLETQDFIAYCIKFAPFNEWEMAKYGQQFKLLNDNGKNKIFHYTNYMINEYLNENQIKDFEELNRLDPIQYKIWGLGLPGRLQESVFNRYLDNASNNPYFKPIRYYGGVDVGQADSPDGHPSVALLVGIDQNNFIKPLSEYIQWNATMPYKSPNQIAKDIVEKFAGMIQQYPDIQQRGCIVNIDYGNGGLAYIDIIKKYQEQLFPYTLKWLEFRPVVKQIYYVKDRIDIIIALLIAKKLLIDKNMTPEMVKQMNMVRYKKALNDRASHKIELIDLYDDFFDALCYSIMDEMKSLVNDINYQNEFLIKKSTMGKY